MLDGVLAQDPLANNRPRGTIWALSLGFQQRFEDAFETAQRLTEVPGKWSVPLPGLGMSCALAGRVEEAHRVMSPVGRAAHRLLTTPDAGPLYARQCGELRPPALAGESEREQ